MKSEEEMLKALLKNGYVVGDEYRQVASGIVSMAKEFMQNGVDITNAYVLALQTFAIIVSANKR